MVPQTIYKTRHTILKYPCNVRKVYVKGESFMDVYLLPLLNCLCALFGMAIAEDVPYGVPILFLTSIAYCLAVTLLEATRRIVPSESVAVLTALSLLGFVLATSLRPGSPLLGYVTCALLGTGLAAFFLNPFLASSTSDRRPIQLVSSFLILPAFVAILAHFLLLGAFGGHSSTLFAIYLIITVTLGMAYFIARPSSPSRIPAQPPTQKDEEVKPIAASHEMRVAPLHPRPLSSAIDGIVAINPYFVESLTNRELQVAQELMCGYDYKQIAGRLSISPHTVVTHRKRIYSKLDVHSVPELITKLERLMRERTKEKRIS